MSEGVEHCSSIGCCTLRARCYNLGCRKALSTRSPPCSALLDSLHVLQPRMSEGVEHATNQVPRVRSDDSVLQPRMSEGGEHAKGVPGIDTRECYNLGCRKALSTLATKEEGDREVGVLQPRMSEGVEHD